MRRLYFCLIALLSQLAAVQAAPDLCATAAKSVEASLRAFRPGAKTGAPAVSISIRNAVAKKPAAGLDYGAILDDAALRKFPLNGNDRAMFKQSVRRIFHAGGKTGLALLDAEAGTAHCHTSFLFSLAAPEPKFLQIPDPDDPYDLCAHRGVALGSVGATLFYAQTYDDFLEIDRLKIFTLAGEFLTEACAIDAHYATPYQTVEKYCAQPELCGAYAARAAQWAQKFGETKGRIADPSLTAASPGATPDDDPAAFPTFGAAATRLVPEPFRFDGEESWFALPGDAKADVLRIGAANQGAANMAQWSSFTLATLYKAGQPVASYVVQRRRGALQSLAVRNAPVGQ
jgi:hypothetical protein